MNLFRISELTKPYTEYDMIQIHTNLPKLPDYQARLLMAFLTKAGETDHTSELITIAASLVQLALDTHDLVPVSNQQKEQKSARARQLKVLAGDYFSSRFYHILSQAGQIDMIQQLSYAICEVNRLKMNLYLRMKQLKVTANDYLSQSVQIRMHLFLSFQKQMTGSLHELWTEVLQSFTQCEVILDEIKRSESLEQFHGSWAFWYIMPLATKEEKKWLQAEESDKLHQMTLKYKSTSALYNMLEMQIQQMLMIIRQLDSEKLKHELLLICEPFSHHMAELQAVKE
jgi:heptaprenyl diphosphate synthase